MNRKNPNFLLLISILVISLFSGADLSYGQSSIRLIGVYRFETIQDFDNFWSGGGQSIAETDGKVFGSDAMIGIAIRVDDAQDGETLTCKFIRPNGSLKGSSTEKYDLDTDCWTSLTGFSKWCGNADNPHLMDMGWLTGGSVAGEQPGIWTIEFLKNGVLIFSEHFELVSRILETVSGNNQKGLPITAIPIPLTVKLLDFDGSGLSGSSVTFTVTSQPKNAGGTGLTEAYNDPPLGAEATSITVNTDTEGMARAYLELGDKPGPYTVTASCPDADIGSPQVFTEYAAELTVGDIEMSAVGDIDLPGIADPFFIANFDPEGNIIVLKNDPIGELVNDSFDLNITLNACPDKPSWNPLTEWKWQIKGLGGPTKGRPFEGWSIAETITPEVRRPDPRYWGDHDLKLDFTFKDSKGSRINTQNEVVTLKLFFDKGFYPTYTDYDGDGVPNWYEYWSKTSASIGDHEYDPTTPYYGYYLFGYKYFYVGPIASSWNNRTKHTGIDCFAETTIHENTHMTDYWNWWPRGYDESKDSGDHDYIPDDIEPSLGLDPTKQDTDGDGDIDFEDRAYDAEKTWNVGSANEEDWANPGKQTVPAY